MNVQEICDQVRKDNEAALEKIRNDRLNLDSEGNIYEEEENMDAHKKICKYFKQEDLPVTKSNENSEDEGNCLRVNSVALQLNEKENPV
jgi:hypothetical protein